MAFDARKSRMLCDLAAEHGDRSRKGGVDAPILHLINRINLHPHFFTTSSCSGRISLFLELQHPHALNQPYHEAPQFDPMLPRLQSMHGEQEQEQQKEHKKKKKKKGGDWLFVSHEAVDADQLIGVVTEKYGKNEIGMLTFRYEPFILALECASVDAAQQLVSCAIASGFRESGITSCKNRVIVAIRCSIRLEVPVAQDGRLLVSLDYLRFLTKLANDKMLANQQRTDKFFGLFSDQFELPKQRSMLEHTTECGDMNRFKAEKLWNAVEALDSNDVSRPPVGKALRQFSRNLSLAKNLVCFRGSSEDSFQSHVVKADTFLDLEDRQKKLLVRIRAMEKETTNRMPNFLKLVSCRQRVKCFGNFIFETEGKTKGSANNRISGVSNSERHCDELEVHDGKLQGALSDDSPALKKDAVSYEHTLISAEGLGVAKAIIDSHAELLCRWGHTTCNLPSTKNTSVPLLMVFGGYGGSGRHGRLNDLLLLNLPSGSLEPVKAVNSPRPRMAHTACIIDDAMWVIGGREDPSTPLGDVLVFHLGSLQWKSEKILGETFHPRHRHAAATVNSKIYVFGGLSATEILNDMYVLDTIRLEWSLLPCEGEKPYACHSHTLAAIGETLYLFGGYGESAVYGDLYMLDLGTLIWKKQKVFGDLPCGRFSHSCTVMGHYLVFVGGCSSSQLMNEVGILDTTCMVWKNQDTSSLKTSLLVRHTANLVGNNLVVIGGGVSCYAFGTVFNSSLSLDMTKFLSNVEITMHSTALFLSKEVKAARATYDCHEPSYRFSRADIREKEHGRADTIDRECDGRMGMMSSEFVCSPLQKLDSSNENADQVLQAATVVANAETMLMSNISSDFYANEKCIEKNSLLVMELDRTVAKMGKDALKELGWLDPTRRAKVLGYGKRVAFPLSHVAGDYFKLYGKHLSFPQDEGNLMPCSRTGCGSLKVLAQQRLYGTVSRCLEYGGKVYESCLMSSSKQGVSPPILLQSKLLDLLEKHGLPNSLGAEIPKRWERLGDMAILPSDCLMSRHWRLLGNNLWTSIVECLGVRKVARQGPISPTGTRDSTVELLLGENGCIEHRENGIIYSFDATKCMFSSGNVSERLRVARFECKDETIVDLFAGIGYFVLPFLLKAGAQKVYACEWNPNALVALRHNLRINFVEDRCIVIEGDNRRTSPQGVADRVCLGLLPSSEESWEVAVKALRPEGGMMHVHENVKDSEELDWVQYLVESIKSIAQSQGLIWTVSVIHVERVKWYAPHIRHLVADVNCSSVKQRELSAQ